MQVLANKSKLEEINAELDKESQRKRAAWDGSTWPPEFRQPTIAELIGESDGTDGTTGIEEGAQVEDHQLPDIVGCTDSLLDENGPMTREISDVEREEEPQVISEDDQLKIDIASCTDGLLDENGPVQPSSAQDFFASDWAKTRDTPDGDAKQVRSVIDCPDELGQTRRDEYLAFRAAWNALGEDEKQRYVAKEDEEIQRFATEMDLYERSGRHLEWRRQCALHRAQQLNQEGEYDRARRLQAYAEDVLAKESEEIRSEWKGKGLAEPTFSQVSSTAKRQASKPLVEEESNPFQLQQAELDLICAKHDTWQEGEIAEIRTRKLVETKRKERIQQIRLETQKKKKEELQSRSGDHLEYLVVDCSAQDHIERSQLLSALQSTLKLAKLHGVSEDEECYTRAQAKIKGLETKHSRAVALVIGNGEYTGLYGDGSGRLHRLPTVALEVTKVSEALTSAGFYVLGGPRYNLKSKTELFEPFQELLRELDERDDRGEETKFVFVYFAGHGVTVMNELYLCPTTAPANPTPAQFRHLIPVSEIQGRLGEVSGRPSGSGVILALNCCRTAVEGFALDDYLPMGAGGAASADSDAASNFGGCATIFSTSPGKEAFSPQSDISPFASSFAEHLTRGMSAEELLRAVANDVTQRVHQQTAKAQIPDITGPLHLPVFGIPFSSGNEGEHQNADSHQSAGEGPAHSGSEDKREDAEQSRQQDQVQDQQKNGIVPLQVFTTMLELSESALQFLKEAEVTVPILNRLAKKGEEHLTNWLTKNVPGLAVGARQSIIDHYF